MVKLINGTILLGCNNDRKTRMSLRDSLVELDDIMETFLTNETILDQKYKVGGTFLATRKGLEKIKRKIYGLKDDDGREIQILNAAILHGLT